MPFPYRQRSISTVALAWALVIFTWPVAWAVAPPSDAGEKNETLLTAMRRIDDMRMALSCKRFRAEQIQAFVQKRQADLLDEMRQRLEALNINTFDPAVKDDRIRFDLRLIGQLRAYSDVLAERIAFFELGDHRLAFYYAQAEDDLKMIQTLSDLGVEKLMAHITEAMASYGQAVQAPLMHADRIPIVPVALLWQQISLHPAP